MDRFHHWTVGSQADNDSKVRGNVPSAVYQSFNPNVVIRENPSADHFTLNHEEPVQKQVPNQTSQPVPNQNSLAFLELRSLATSLSAQNQNLQRIAVEAKDVIKQKETELGQMATHLNQMKEYYERQLKEIEDRLKDRLTRAEERLQVFERATQFEMILRTYNT